MFPGSRSALLIALYVFCVCCRVDNIPMSAEWPLDQFIKYMCTWSGYQLHMKTYPQSRVMEDFHDK